MPRQTQWPTPSRDGIALQHSSIGLFIGDRAVYFPWINEVEYNMKVEPGESEGTSPFPTGVTVGKASASATLSINRIYREKFFDLIDPNKLGPFGSFFSVQVGYSEIGWSNVETDQFDARLTEVGANSSAGNGALVTKVSLYVPGLVIFNKRAPIQGVLV